MTDIADLLPDLVALRRDIHSHAVRTPLSRAETLG